MKLNVSYPGGKEIGGELDELNRKLNDFTPVWPKLRKVLNEYQKEMLETQGFGSYASLKPSTIKKGHRRSNKPFDTRSRRMVRSMFGMTDDTVYEFGPHHMTYGTNLPFVKYHMTGTPKMPARPPLMITQKLIKMVNAVFREYLQGKYGRP